MESGFVRVDFGLLCLVSRPSWRYTFTLNHMVEVQKISWQLLLFLVGHTVTAPQLDFSDHIEVFCRLKLQPVTLRTCHTTTSNVTFFSDGNTFWDDIVQVP